jgi:hypothetical protein
MRSSRQNKINGQIIISNIDCSRLAIDKHANLYVSDCVHDEVTRWKRADKNGKGDQLDQFHYPRGL